MQYVVTIYFQSFLTGTIRLQLPLEASKSVAIDCQSINKIQNTSINNNCNTLNTTQTEEDGYCLCALAWFSTQEEKNKLLLFDLNQWYKEEMPFSITNQKCPSYLAGYVLSGRQCALSTYLNPSTVAHFNSLQRFEEHFYPNSLSFGEYYYYVYYIYQRVRISNCILIQFAYTSRLSALTAGQFAWLYLDWCSK